MTNDEVIYDVIQQKFRASLEYSWAMKINRYVEQPMHRSSEYIYKLPFALSNKVT